MNRIPLNDRNPTEIRTLQKTAPKIHPVAMMGIRAMRQYPMANQFEEALAAFCRSLTVGRPTPPTRDQAVRMYLAAVIMNRRVDV